MKTRIDWVRTNCRLLAAIGEEFVATQPFAGRTIGAGLHLEGIVTSGKKRLPRRILPTYTKGPSD
jgi:S-adenosylhomocysteine hydrolase